jgi:hypothetical protein
MPYAKGAEETFELLSLLPKEPRRIKLIVVTSPDVWVVMDNMVRAEYRGLVVVSLCSSWEL